MTIAEHVPGAWPEGTRPSSTHSLIRAAPHLPEGQEPPRSEILPKGFVSGASFVLDVPDLPPAVWGVGGDVLWAEGEACMIAAPQGVGKTTLAHQLVRARLGLQSGV